MRRTMELYFSNCFVHLLYLKIDLTLYWGWWFCIRIFILEFVRFHFICILYLLPLFKTEWYLTCFLKSEHRKGKSRLSKMRSFRILNKASVVVNTLLLSRLIFVIPTQRLFPPNKKFYKDCYNYSRPGCERNTVCACVLFSFYYRAQTLQALSACLWIECLAAANITIKG